jgi:DNA-binding CsgD family transcriptional regulator
LGREARLYQISTESRTANRVSGPTVFGVGQILRRWARPWEADLASMALAGLLGCAATLGHNAAVLARGPEPVLGGLAAALLAGLLRLAIRARRPGSRFLPHGGRVDTKLTPNELDVLRLLGEHCTYRAVSAELAVSEETVRTHVKSMLRKLGRRRPSAAQVWA